MASYDDPRKRIYFEFWCRLKAMDYSFKKMNDENTNINDTDKKILEDLKKFLTELQIPKEKLILRQLGIQNVDEYVFYYIPGIDVRKVLFTIIEEKVNTENKTIENVVNDINTYIDNKIKSTSNNNLSENTSNIEIVSTLMTELLGKTQVALY